MSSRLDKMKFAAAILPDLLGLGRTLYEMFDGDPKPARALLRRVHSFKAEVLRDRAELDAARSAFHAEQTAAAHNAKPPEDAA